MPVLEDGLDVLRAELKIGEIMQLIERTARWVDPETLKLLPVWYPESARRIQLYNGNWSTPRMNKNRRTSVEILKLEGNVDANKALTAALGYRKSERTNWSCCHIWGVDDPTYQIANAIVQDHKFYSCVANMVLLPSPLKAFTDSMPEVKTMLRVCAYHLYGWYCDDESVTKFVKDMKEWTDWSVYPQSWPKEGRQTLPLGLVHLTDAIKMQAERRKNKIASDWDMAGENYPREQVEAARKYWVNFFASRNKAGNAVDTLEGLSCPSSSA